MLGDCVCIFHDTKSLLFGSKRLNLKRGTNCIKYKILVFFLIHYVKKEVISTIIAKIPARQI